MRHISLFKAVSVFLFFGIASLWAEKENFLKTDFKENQVPKIYEGAYFSDDGNTDFILNRQFLNFHKDDEHETKYFYYVLEVNNYYPSVGVETKEINKNLLVYQKRYIVVIDKKGSFDIVMFLWSTIDKKDENSFYLFYHRLYTGKNKSELIKLYEEGKRRGRLKVIIDKKEGVFSGRYTKFLT